LTEEELLEVINRAMAEVRQQRYAVLRARRRKEALTAEEQAEFLQLTTEAEHLNVTRLQALAALAQLRKVSLDEVMEQLGIQAPPYE
jgi:hypothetical protein